MDIFERLSEPFDPKDIEFRVGSTNRDKTKALALAYVTSRAIMDRLDEVVGPTEWHNEVKIHEQGVVATLTIRVGGEWVMRQDGAQYTNIESFKGGISDALKRVAVLFGMGRYLYRLPAMWVPIKNGYIQDKAPLYKALGGVKSTPKKIITKTVQHNPVDDLPVVETEDIPKHPGGMSQAYTDSGQQAKDENMFGDLPPVEPEVISFGDDEVKRKVAANVAKAKVRSTTSNVVHGVKDTIPSVDGLMDSGISASEVTLNDKIYAKASAKQQNMCNIIMERVMKKDHDFNPVNFCSDHDTTKSMIEALIDYAVSIGQWTRRG